MTVSATQITRSYNQDDIQQILASAIARQANDSEFTHEQLVEIAAELDISLECLQAAEQDWLAQQGELQKRQDFNIYRRGKLQKSLGKYAIVNTFLIPLNLVSAGEISWSLYILLFWGLGLGLNAWNAYQSDGEDYERAFQQWYRKHQIKQSINTFFNKFLNAYN